MFGRDKKGKKTISENDYNSLKEMSLQAIDLHKELDTLQVGNQKLKLAERFKLHRLRLEKDVEKHKDLVNRRVQAALHPSIEAPQEGDGESPSQEYVEQ